MFQASSIRLPQHRRHNNLRTFVTSSFSSPNDSKEPSRRGLMFIVVAGVLLLVGSFLTWFGFYDVFGGKIVIGPLLIALALILLLVCTRQFFKARKHNRNRLQLGPLGQGTLRAVVVDHNDGLGAVTFIMDPLDVEANQQNRLLQREPSFNQSNRFANMENYAPPTYSEVADINGTNLRPYSPQNQDEPPPPYLDAILTGDGHFTLQLPKYEAIGGRRSPVPKYEDIFVTSSVPGLVSTCHPPACLSIGHCPSSPRQLFCHAYPQPHSPNPAACSNSNSESSQLSHICVHHPVNPSCSQGHHGVQPSLCFSHGNSGGQDHDHTISGTGQSHDATSSDLDQGQTVTQVERENSNLSQCTVQSMPCCVGHNPCCGCSHVTSCSCSHTPPPSCSPHGVIHRSCEGTHFTFPCVQSTHSCSNHPQNTTNHNLDQTGVSTNQEQGCISSNSLPITTTGTTSTLHQGNAPEQDPVQSEPRIGISAGMVDQSHGSRENVMATNAPIRTFSTPTQDTEHTF